MILGISPTFPAITGGKDYYVAGVKGMLSLKPTKMMTLKLQHGDLVRAKYPKPGWYLPKVSQRLNK